MFSLTWSLRSWTSAAEVVDECATELSAAAVHGHVLTNDTLPAVDRVLARLVLLFA